MIHNEEFEPEELDPYIYKHLDNYIHDNVIPDDQDAFRQFALSRAKESERAMWMNWSALYGIFISSELEENKS